MHSAAHRDHAKTMLAGAQDACKLYRVGAESLRMRCLEASHLDVMVAMLCEEHHEECLDRLAAVQRALCAHLQPDQIAHMANDCGSFVWVWALIIQTHLYAT